MLKIHSTVQDRIARESVSIKKDEKRISRKKVKKEVRAKDNQEEVRGNETGTSSETGSAD